MTAPSFDADACDLHPARHDCEIPHGTHCECIALAAALGLPPGAISFAFCARMLQRRWSMECRHGLVEHDDEQPSSYEKWKDQGDMTQVLAILVKNG